MPKQAFIAQPNLPGGAVTLCAVSGGHPAVCRVLRARGIEVIEVHPVSGLAPPVACHADMALHHLGGGQVVVAQQAEALADTLRQAGFAVTLTPQPVGDAYPRDCALNCARVGRLLFAGEKSLSPLLRQYCTRQGIHIVTTPQGYAKCSTCIVTPDAIITADPSIAAAAAGQGIEVLSITPGNILLPGYPYGFIGGCCGMIDKDVMAFTGELAHHPDGEKILGFLSRHGVRAVALTPGALVDVGSIIPLRQEQIASFCHTIE